MSTDVISFLLGILGLCWSAWGTIRRLSQHFYVMSTASPPSFGRAGRPRRIDFSDLFLWDPAIEFDLTGISMTGLMGEINPKMLSLYQDVRRKRPISIERVKKVLPTLSTNIGLPLAEEYRKAFDGEESMVSNWGGWRSYIYSQYIKEIKGDQRPPKVSRIGQHLIDIEEALKEPTLAWQQSDFALCADLLAACSVLAPYLWPGALDTLRNAVSVKQVTTLRCMVMLEIMLSLIAAWDAQVQLDGFAAEASFERLFPDLSANELIQPNALFFDWLEFYSGVGSNLPAYIPQISKPEKNFDIGSAKRQLRRWKSGDTFPSFYVLDAMLRKLYGDKASEKNNPRRNDWYLSWLMASATRRINFMMGILEPLRHHREPVFPFGHKTVQEWRESRYPHWYRFWLPLLQPHD